MVEINYCYGLFTGANQTENVTKQILVAYGLTRDFLCDCDCIKELQ